MSIVSSASIAANIGQHFARPVDFFTDTPEVASLAIDARLCDVLAWMNDDSDNFAEDFVPGWDAEGYDPSEEDDREYAAMLAMLASLGGVGGCPAGTLSPDEEDILTWSQADVEWRAEMYEAAERIEWGCYL